MRKKLYSRFTKVMVIISLFFGTSIIKADEIDYRAPVFNESSKALNDKIIQENSYLLDYDNFVVDGMITVAGADVVYNIVIPNAGVGGTIEGIENFKKIENLDLSGNSFIGEIPDDFSRHVELKEFNVSNNNFTGNFPESLSTLSDLESINASGNNFSGNLITLSNNQSLKTVNLSRNNFEGSIPPEFSNAKNLEIIELQFNKLSGTIPASLGAMDNLRYFAVDYNDLSGDVPVELGNLSTIEKIVISNNPNLTGDSAEIFSKTQSLRVLHVINTAMNQSRPTGAGMNTSKSAFYQNLLNPSRDNLLESTTVEIIDIADKEITNGDGINSYRYDQYWEQRVMGRFMLEAQTAVDALFANETDTALKPGIEKKDIDAAQDLVDKVTPNNLEGELRKELDTRLNLARAILDGDVEEIEWAFEESSRALNDEIIKKYPTIDTNNDKFISKDEAKQWAGNEIILPNLGITGTINGLENFNLKHIDLSNNNFSGNISSKMGDMNSLERLFLSNNEFTGNIPSSFNKLDKLKMLDLSNNKFSGSITQILENNQSLEFMSIYNTDIQISKSHNTSVKVFLHSVINEDKDDLLPTIDETILETLKSEILVLKNEVYPKNSDNAAWYQRVVEPLESDLQIAEKMVEAIEIVNGLFMEPEYIIIKEETKTEDINAARSIVLNLGSGQLFDRLTLQLESASNQDYDRKMAKTVNDLFDSNGKIKDNVDEETLKKYDEHVELVSDETLKTELKDKLKDARIQLKDLEICDFIEALFDDEALKDSVTLEMIEDAKFMVKDISDTQLQTKLEGRVEDAENQFNHIENTRKEVENLFDDLGVIKESTNISKIEDAALNVSAIKTVSIKDELENKLELAKIQLFDRDLKDKVEGLFDKEGLLNQDVKREEIEQLEEEVLDVNDAILKTELLKKLNEAKQQFDDRVIVEEIDALFEEDGSIKYSLIKADVEAVEKFIDDIHDEQLKTASTDRINSAYDQLDHNLETSKSVEKLFNNDGTIKDTVSEEDLESAQKLIDDVKNTQLKEELQETLNEAKKQFNINAYATEVVNALFDLDGTIKDEVNERSISDAQKAVDDVTDQQLQEDLNALLSIASKQLEVNSYAKEMVLNLFDDHEIIKETTDREEIKKAQKAVDLVEKESLKEELNDKLQKADHQLYDRNTQALVESLFEDDDSLKYETTIAQINDAKDAVELVHDTSLKETLNIRVKDANKQYEDQEKAKNSVNELFENNGSIKETTNQSEINKTQTAINNVKNTKVKNDLQDRVDEAQKQLDEREANKKAAKDAVQNLFDDDGILKAEIEQEQINDAKALVSKVTDVAMKQELNDKIIDAEDQLFDRGIKNTVDALFEDDGSVKYATTQSDIDTVEQTLSSVNSPSLKIKLQDQIDEAKTQVAYNTSTKNEVEKLFDHEGKIKQNVDRSKVEEIQALVKDVKNLQVREELQDKIDDALEQVSEKEAYDQEVKDRVEALFNADGSLKQSVKEEDITTSKTLVKEVSNSEIKQDLEAKLLEAEKQFSDRNIKEAVDALFEDDGSIKYTTSQSDINAAEAQLDNLNNEDLKLELQNTIKEAKTQFDYNASTKIAVESLFQSDGTIESHVNHKAVSDAQNLVNEVKNNQLKDELQIMVDDALVQVKAKETTNKKAEEAVKALFHADGTLKQSVKEDDISDAKDLVNEVSDTNLKQELDAKIVDAENQLQDRNIKHEIDKLFEANGSIKYTVHQKNINDAEALLVDVNNEDLKNELQNRIDDANAQIQHNSSTTIKVNDLFKEDGTIKDNVNRSKIEEVQTFVDDVKNIQLKEELQDLVDDASKQVSNNETADEKAEAAVKALFKTDGTLRDHVDEDKIAETKILVSEVSNPILKQDLEAKIRDAEKQLSDRNIKDKVEALFEADGSVKYALKEDEISSVENTLSEVNDSTLKHELQNKIDEARKQVTYNEAVQDEVDALFNPNGSLKESVNRTKVETVELLLDDVKNVQLKDELQEKIDEAFEQVSEKEKFDQKAKEAVAALFNVDGTLKDSVDQKQIDDARTLVNHVSDAQVKIELTQKLSDADHQLSDRIIKNKVESLFEADGSIKYESTPSDVERIEAELIDVHDAALKDSLQEKIDDAKSQITYNETVKDLIFELFDDENVIVDSVDGLVLDNAQKKVEDVKNARLKEELQDHLNKATDQLSDNNEASELVNALFTSEGNLDENVDKSQIEDAQRAVDKVLKETLKQSLQIKVDEAKKKLYDREAEIFINNLFEANGSVKYEVNDDDISNAQEILAEVNDISLKQQLENKVEDAQEQVRYNRDTTARVEGLFDNKGQLKSGVDESDISSVEDKVNEIKNTKLKDELQEKIDEARHQWQERNDFDAKVKEKVEKLFDTQGVLKADIKQADLNKLADDVSKVSDESLKDDLDLLLIDANKQLYDRNTVLTVNALFNVNGNINNHVTDDLVKEAQLSVSSVNDANLKLELQVKVDEAARQQNSDNDVEKSVSELFDADGSIKSSVNQEVLDDVIDSWNTVYKERLKEELKESLDEAREQLETNLKATEAVRSLFDANGKIFESTDQEAIDKANTLVEKVKKNSLKEQLLADLDNASKQVYDRETKDAIKSLFNEDGTIKESVDEEILSKLENNVKHVSDEVLKFELTQDLREARRQFEINNVQKKVNDLFDEHGKVKESVSEKDIDEIEKMIERLTDGQEKEELFELLEKAKQQIDQRYTYSILESNLTFTGKEKIYLKVDAPYAWLQDVLVDGVVLSKSLYRVSEGSTIVEFEESFIKSLSEGKHDLSLEFKTDKTIKSKIDVDLKQDVLKDKETTPKTSVFNSQNTFVILLLIALFTVIVLRRKNRTIDSY